MQDSSDEILMSAYASGDPQAFEVLHARHRGPLFRYLKRQLRDRALAEDLYQDVWMRVINARNRYVSSARFTTWLYTIAHHRVMDHFRSARLREAGRLGAAVDDDSGDPLHDIADPSTPPPDQLLAREQLVRRVVAAVDALPLAQREAFVLQQEGGFALDEIAQAKRRRRSNWHRLRRAILMRLVSGRPQRRLPLRHSPNPRPLSRRVATGKQRWSRCRVRTASLQRRCPLHQRYNSRPSSQCRTSRRPTSWRPVPVQPRGRSPMR